MNGRELYSEKEYSWIMFLTEFEKRGSHWGMPLDWMINGRTKDDLREGGIDLVVIFEDVRKLGKFWDGQSVLGESGYMESSPVFPMGVKYFGKSVMSSAWSKDIRFDVNKVDLENYKVADFVAHGTSLPNGKTRVLFTTYSQIDR